MNKLDVLCNVSLTNLHIYGGGKCVTKKNPFKLFYELT